MSIILKDPINGGLVKVKSVCHPTQSLLQGAPYSRENYILAVPPKHPVPFKPLLLK